jgi:hypothetical protein
MIQQKGAVIEGYVKNEEDANNPELFAEALQALIDKRPNDKMVMFAGMFSTEMAHKIIGMLTPHGKRM